MRQLYFIRHGESEFNRAHKWSSSTDVPLTKTGQKQARKAGQKMKNQALSFDVIVSSPLIRAHQTAQHVAEAIDYPSEKIVIHDNLVERQFGVLEGKNDLVAATRYIYDESAIDHYEEVEKLIELQERAEQVLEYLHTLPYDTILIVGHGAFGRALRRAIKNEPLRKRGKSFGNAEYERLI